MPKRGSFGFETVDGADRIRDCAENVDRLRNLWLNRRVLSFDQLGPGDPGDFDFGAWHISCHLVAAAAVMEDRDGGLLWLQVSHRGGPDEYLASVTSESPDGALTYDLTSEPGRHAGFGARLLGFIEGASRGRISARNVADGDACFNGNRRQDYDEPVESEVDGGRVWEHWCTLRDLRPSVRVSRSVLAAYVTLASVLGDEFASTIGRGRKGYGHPQQLRAMEEAGFVGGAGAVVDEPHVVPRQAELLIREGQPDRSLEAASLLDWRRSPVVYMFERSAAEWHSI